MTSDSEPHWVRSTLFDELVGEDVFAYILKTAPTKVKSRIHQALDHFIKARKLEGIDEEMAVIRLIAAEEELVVSLFEWFKLNTVHFPSQSSFVRSHKNHRVKLAFHPVLACFSEIFGGMFSEGISFEGLEEVSWRVAPALTAEGVKLHVVDQTGKFIFEHDPLSIVISRSDRSEDETVTSLLEEFRARVSRHGFATLREYITQRSEFRNKILYAHDGGSFLMEESLNQLLPIFERAYRDLLWTLAILLRKNLPSNGWGIINQFLELYCRVLDAAGVLGRPP